MSDNIHFLMCINLGLKKKVGTTKTSKNLVNTIKFLILDYFFKLEFAKLESTKCI
mgnify:FL=1